jgi:hypothetical protein
MPDVRRVLMLRTGLLYLAAAARLAAPAKHVTFHKDI